jgi:hypothetical protein
MTPHAPREPPDHRPSAHLLPACELPTAPPGLHDRASPDTPNSNPVPTTWIPTALHVEDTQENATVPPTFIHAAQGSAWRRRRAPRRKMAPRSIPAMSSAARGGGSTQREICGAWLFSRSRGGSPMKFMPWRSSQNTSTSLNGDGERRPGEGRGAALRMPQGSQRPRDFIVRW